MQSMTISKLAPSQAIKTRGRVAEIFGNKFILQDDTGGRWSNLAPRAHEEELVDVGKDVVVEGRFKHGFIHATALTTRGRRRTLGGKGDGPEKHPAAEYNHSTVLAAAAKAGFSDARIIDAKKHHAEVVAKDKAGVEYELHIEFDGKLRHKMRVAALGEFEIKALIEKEGYTYDGSMRPEKKHMVVAAKNTRGKRVTIDVHRDGRIRREEPR